MDLALLPSEDDEGKPITCNPADTDLSSVHLHSVTTPHNHGRIFWSPAPGFAMGVGSIRERFLPYEEGDTFISTDAGVTWQMARRDAHKYEFGDKGNNLVVMNDEDRMDNLRHSLDLVQYEIGIKFQARALMSPDRLDLKDDHLRGRIVQDPRQRSALSLIPLLITRSTSLRLKMTLSRMHGCAHDLPCLQQLGVYTVRVYSVDSIKNYDLCMKAFSGADVYTISPAWSTNLLDQYLAAIDAFSKYDNILACHVGNEVINSSSNTNVAPFVKAAARGIKAYLEWCGNSTFAESYTNNFAGYNFAAYFSEYGCVPPSAVKLFYVMSKYCESQNRKAQACSFAGNGTVNSHASTSVSATGVASSCIASLSATFAPTAPASSSGSSSTGTTSSGGGTKKNGASTLVGGEFVGMVAMGVVVAVSGMWTVM
ncbi:glycoside hydrolase family 72 protein [Laccaria bicolor S238N-H82]|uniref:1,3-beta-glucanosyltransferase n=1 Tax=Laccaria bicolor (strain S238N-H82 / ATCC MYA-4686) TaxID=486041 RepID=B0E402_LACBS|nr:glycoside hydrolase family 72 protein [Laccaria bicolor S238N-H82]EDQ98428.1 glycoside hydrolase family 72 protein [Laccaria bicolor S238N-H82]|eukprot:XP_001890921.1 glycoside hydrolase family 72 protein [Laccaria bicolor S238N-H82]